MSPSRDPVLECAGLVKSYGERRVVDDVAFEIAAGETYGLLGPNGAGKTTAISMIVGVLERDAGEVVVCGRRISAGSVEGKANIGVVPQEVALYPDLSAVENLRFFGRLQGLWGTELATRIDETLAIVGLSERGHDRIEEYSGGMKRRANIAAGLLHRPRLLILDEPTVGVDPQSRNAILASVEELGGAGLSVLYTTHYMEEAERLCDRIGIIDHGKLIAEGTTHELVASIGHHDRLRFSVSDGIDAFIAWSEAAPDVLGVSRQGEVVTLQVEDGSAAVPAVVAGAANVGASITGLDIVVPDLEEVFLHLTGRALRDQA